MLDLDLGVHDDNVSLNIPRSSLTYENILGYEVMSLQGLYSITLENIQLIYNGPFSDPDFRNIFKGMIENLQRSIINMPLFIDFHLFILRMNT